MEWVRQLREVVGDRFVVTEPALIESYVNDWTGRFRGHADAVVLPGDVAEVCAVMQLCSRRGIRVHPQGGNTGLVGGSVPMRQALQPGDAQTREGVGATVVLSMTRLAGIGAVDARAGVVTAQAGATLASVQQHAAQAGWYYGVDIAARDSATIGGTVATNAGGIRVCAFGMTRAQVMGLQAVLPDGTLVDHLGGLPKDNTGYDWPGLFTGSEGTLGVITAATLRLHRPVGESTLVLLGLDSYAAAGPILDAIARAGQMLLAAEVMERRGLDIVCRFADLPYPLARSWPLFLLLEVAGDEIEIPADSDAIMAGDRADYARIWRYREHQSEAASVMAADIGGVIHKLDVSLPLELIGEFIDRMHPILSGLPAVVDHYVFGHIADGNLHVEIAEHTAGDDTATIAVLELVAELGGSISAEHGIGHAKAKYLGYSRSPAEIALMRSIKSAVDPAGLMAPGVIFAD